MADAPYRLLATLPDGSQVALALRPGDPVIVGRANDCPLTLTGDGRASRHHAAFELRGPEAWVRDLGSRNGILVNGRGATESALRPGDEVVLGGSRVRLEADGAVPEAGGTVCHRCGRELPGDATVAGAAPLCGHCGRGGAGVPAVPGYELKRKLGAGAVGDVWLAHDQQRGCDIALKLLMPREGQSPMKGALARFVREARAMQALEHRNAVRLLEAGSVDGLHYIAMEYVAGPTYEQLLETQGPISLGEAGRLVMRLCDCLGVAHAQGIIHRDVKPGNILREDAGGEPKLTDFGLARLAQQTGLSVQSMSSAGMGSPLYMPPEQISAIEKCDHRADLYSLGATVFHLLAGRPVFPAPSVAEIVVKVLDDPPPALHDLVMEVPPVISQAVAWSLEKDPDRRYGNAGEMAEAFRSAFAAAKIDVA